MIKRIFSLLIVAIILASCNNTPQQSEAPPSENKVESASAPAIVLGQGLESMPPVLLDSSSNITQHSASFMLNVQDFHNFAKQGEPTYSCGIQIIDADQPWPPRWFTSADIQIHDSITAFEDLYIDSRHQGKYITFYTSESKTYPSSEKNFVKGYIICNEKLEPIDTFSPKNSTLNFHQFRINDKGEKLLMVQLDTMLNMSSIPGGKPDTLLKATVDLIEIFNASGKLIFKWNPVKFLGVGAFYWPYRWDNSFSSKPGILDWSHGNALDWDFDGNIIYSFRNIGIGKISRTDGHVIWHLERNKMPYIFGKDTLALYMQHGFEKLSDDAMYTTYEIYSNGDYVHHSPDEPDHPGSYGLKFRVNKKNYAIQVLRKKFPYTETLSFSSGNYEIEKNGDYLMSYGYTIYRNPPEGNALRVFLEYGSKNNDIYGLYKMPLLTVAYNVHLLDGWRPPRPSITSENGMLTAHGNMKNWIWYQLDGDDHTVAKKVGEGSTFKPAPGIATYCVSGKYGLGWSVSPAFQFKP